MKIAFHDNTLSLRGTTVAMYDYAYYTRKYLGNDSIILYDTRYPQNNQDVYNKFIKEFKVYGYKDRLEIDQILYKEKCDYFLMLKGGKPDGVISNVSKNLINAISVCNKSDVHGDVFAMGSKWLSKITNWEIPYVPYMVSLPDIDIDMRSELNIPKSDIVLGRNGGWETFDIPFVKESISDILNRRSDIWFIFQFTEPFIKHERVIYLPGTPDLNNKVKFINTCDAMIHARYIGESFGLSCAEFSIRNKPVITWDGSPERNHIDTLGDKGIYYQDKNSLIRILSNLDKSYLNSSNWNMYGDYTPDNVVKKFNEVYLSR
jgi:hypothetical protein